ncbi:MAG: hypothetical protein JRN09_09695 [Nitrososphaerota archaeon]|nr:hypothetical protein [Nitrososphaerota archaeon]
MPKASSKKEPEIQERSPANNPSEIMDGLANSIKRLRKQPLLVMFYYEYAGRISHEDVRDIYDEFRRRGWSRDSVKPKLDVLIHCYGGDANASYRVSQIIHDFADDVTFLVPYHATSGATLVSLGGSSIRLGAYAGLGPIDITMGGVELASIDAFKEFARDCRREIEELLKTGDSDRTTEVESVLLCEMVKQETALGIGSLYRTSSLTGHYAFRLLFDYMFKDHSNRQVLAQSIADQLLHTYPSHDFALDSAISHHAPRLGK